MKLNILKNKNGDPYFCNLLRIFRLNIKSNARIELCELCDEYFRIDMNKNEAIELFEEIILFIKNSKYEDDNPDLPNYINDDGTINEEDDF